MSDSTVIPYPGLVDILAKMHPDGSGLTERIPDSWLQGRTAFGGLSAALLLEAVRRQHSNLRPLRSGLINFTAPFGGKPAFTSRVLRHGRNISAIAADARDGDKVLCRATFVFGADIPGAETHEGKALPAPKPVECPDLFGPGKAFTPPRFIRNFEIRRIDGTLPFSGVKRGHLRVWARHRAQAAHSGTVPLLCLADILPPAAMIPMTRPAINSSVNWICNFLRTNSGTGNGWHQVETALSADHNGYSSQTMRVWDMEGRLVLDGMQSVVIFT